MRVQKNYIDAKGNYHNVENLTLTQIHDRASEEGYRLGKEDIIKYIATQYSEHNELVPIWLSIGDLKGGQAERNCEKCEHYKQKTEGVPGDGLYGCELGDCIYERGPQNVK